MENSVYYTGIDAHKRNCFLVTRDMTGKIVKQADLTSNGQALRDYFSDLPGLHKVVVESTSAWYWISDAFRGEDQIELSLAHSKYVKAISYAKVKTDKVDAGTLADLHRSDLVPLAHQISPELRGLRDMLRARLRLVQRQTTARNSIARVFEKFNVSSVADLDPLYREQVACYQEHVTLYSEHIKRLEARIWALVRMNDEVRWLMQLPGVGRIVALTIYLEIDGIDRFESIQRFWSYARLVPGSDNSARKQRHKPSKDGNRYLKLAFSHAAVRAVQHYPVVKAWEQRNQRRKNRAIARTLVAKEIAKMAYYILKKREPFNGQFKGKTIA
jgi:transposase